MDNSDKNEHKGNKVFYAAFFFLIITSVVFTFYKIVILKDYQILAQVSCDQVIEKCFVSVCDPTEDDTCPLNPDEQITYYKNISKNAGMIYACEKTVEKVGCEEELSCTVGEPNCSYTLCDLSQLVDDEQCSE